MSVAPPPPKYLGPFSDPAKIVPYRGFDASQIPPHVLNQQRTEPCFEPAHAWPLLQRNIHILDDFGLDKSRFEKQWAPPPLNHSSYVLPVTALLPRFGPAPPPSMSPPYLSLN